MTGTGKSNSSRLLYEIINKVNTQPSNLVDEAFRDEVYKDFEKFLKAENLEQSSFSGIDPSARPQFLRKVSVSVQRKIQIKMSATRLTDALL